jgi:hypothetical protein
MKKSPNWKKRARQPHPEGWEYKTHPLGVHNLQHHPHIWDIVFSGMDTS